MLNTWSNKNAHTKKGSTTRRMLSDQLKDSCPPTISHSVRFILFCLLLVRTTGFQRDTKCPLGYRLFTVWLFFSRGAVYFLDFGEKVFFSRIQQRNYENRALNFVIKSALNSIVTFSKFLNFWWLYQRSSKKFVRV